MQLLLQAVSKATFLLAAAALSAVAYGQTRYGGNDPHENDNASSAQAQVDDADAAYGDEYGESEQAEDVSDAQEQIDDAAAVVQQMKSDPELMQVLEQARGVLIIPDYGQAAAIVGGEGGEGVALVRAGGQPGAEWSAPAFYNIGGVSIGAAAGVEAGSIALLLMTDQTVEMLMGEDNNFSLDADAGLTIVDWSAKAQASTGIGDVIVWSDTEGAFAGASIGVSDIAWDDDENRAYYGANVTARQVLSGDVDSQQASQLRNALSG